MNEENRNEEHFFLEDIVRCGQCGRRLAAVRTGYGVRYFCKEPTCRGITIWNYSLRDLALEYVKRACSEETRKAVREMIEQNRLATNAELERTRADCKALEKQIKKLEAQIQKKREKMRALQDMEQVIAQCSYPDASAYFKAYDDSRLAMEVNWKTREEVLRAYIQRIEVKSDMLTFTSTFGRWLREHQGEESKTVRADGFEKMEEAHD